jgi:hypothetical protein
VYYKDSGQPVDGVRVVIQGKNTPEFRLGENFEGWEVPDELQDSDENGKIMATSYRALRDRNMPPGIYTIYAYKGAKDLSKDLWPDREYKIAIPSEGGLPWRLRIFMTEIGPWWKKK